MGHCKDCKWWDHEHPPDMYFTIQRLRDKYATWRMCRQTDTEEMNPVHSESKALAIEEWSATLMTAPDFGCVQFEQRG